MREPDALILGGGILGLACARQLARQGLAVTLVEAQGDPAVIGSRSASWAAAGMLAPLVEAPEEGPLSTAARASRDLWPQLVAELEEETRRAVEYDASGTLMVALDPAQEAYLEFLVAAARRLGEPVLEVAPADLQRRVPDLAVPDRTPAHRALLFPGEQRVDNRLACRALEHSVRSLGVEVLLGHPVQAVEASADGVLIAGDGWRRSAPWLIVAAGAWSGRIPGLPALPLRPIKGEMIRLDGIAWPWSGVVRTPFAYAVRRGRDSLLVGATEEAVGFDTATSTAGQRALLAMVARLFPSLAGHPPAAHWAGLRPGTPDHLPLVGPLAPPFHRVVLATGHYRHGILLAPWTAHRIGDLVAGKAPDATLAAFAPTRLALPGC